MKHDKNRPTHQSVPSFIISRDTLDKAHGEALMKIHLKQAGVVGEYTAMEILAFFVLRETGRLE